MDYLRTGRLQLMKLWPQEDYWIQVRWFRAPPGAKGVPFPTVWGHPDWDYGTGAWDVPSWQDTPYGYDKGENPLGYRGLHPCGPLEAWQGLAVWGQTPPIYTRDDGSAECCDLPERDDQGSLVWDGNGLDVEEAGGDVLFVGQAEEEGAPMPTPFRFGTELHSTGSPALVYTVPAGQYLKILSVRINAEGTFFPSKSYLILNSAAATYPWLFLYADDADSWVDWSGVQYLFGGEELLFQSDGEASITLAGEIYVA